MFVIQFYFNGDRKEDNNKNMIDVTNKIREEKKK
jgi:hypothetical protein